MRALLSWILSLSLVMNQCAYAFPNTEQQAVDKIVKIWGEGKTVAQILEAFQSSIPADTYEFLLDKLAAEKANQQPVPKLIRRGPNLLTLDFSGTMFSFGIKNLEKNEFLVNQKAVEILVNEAPEVIWKKVERAFHVSKTAGLFNLFVPQAEALAIVVGVTLIALTVGAGLYVANDYLCKKIELAMIDCETKIMDFTSGNYADRKHDPKRQISEAKRVVKKLDDVEQNRLCRAAVRCGDTTQDLKICIDKLVDQTKQTLKVDLRRLPKNVTADSEIDASDAVE